MEALSRNGGRTQAMISKRSLDLVLPSLHFGVGGPSLILELNKMEKRRKRDKTGQNGSLALQDTENNSSKDMDVAPNRWQNQGIASTAAAAAPQDTQAAVKVQPPPYWPYSEFPPPRPYFPVTPASVDRQQSSSQHGHNPPPFPGPWQPPPWFLPYPPFFCPPPPPGNPALQKGVVKTPQGLSQKHQKLWEQQSAENIQLWSTIARIEAELAAQRSRVSQLEADLQSLKAARQEPANEPSLLKEAPKRGRYKRTVIGNIPPEAIAPRPRGRKPAGGVGRKPSTLLSSTQTKPQVGDGTPGTNQVNAAKENGGGFGQPGVPSSGYSNVNWTAQTNGGADDDDGEDRW